MSESLDLKEIQNDSETDLADIASFLIKYAKLLTLVTFGLTTISFISVILLIPRVYSKEIILSITPLALPINGLSDITNQEIDGMTMASIETYHNDLTSLKTNVKQYNKANNDSNDNFRQFKITFKTKDKNYLSNIDVELQNILSEQFFKFYSNSLEKQIFRLDITIKRQRMALAQLEKEIAQVSTLNNSDSDKIKTFLRLQELESKRIDILSNMNFSQFDRQYLKSSQNKLKELISKLFIIDIISDSEIKPTSSSLQIAILAAIVSFLVALLVAIVKDQLARLELPKYSEKTVNIEPNEMESNN